MLHRLAQVFFGTNSSSSSSYETCFLDMSMTGSSSEHFGDSDEGAMMGSDAIKTEANDRFFVVRKEGEEDGRTADELGRPSSLLPLEPN